MRNFQNTFETPKRSLISVFSICMTCTFNYTSEKLCFMLISIAEKLIFNRMKTDKYKYNKPRKK